MRSTCVGEIDDSSFDREVTESSGRVVVDFFGRPCPPCETIAPKLERVCREADGAYRVLKLNARENIETSLRFRITAIPTLICFEDGEPIAQHTGDSMSPEALRAWIEGSRRPAD